MVRGSLGHCATAVANADRAAERVAWAPTGRSPRVHGGRTHGRHLRRALPTVAGPTSPPSSTATSPGRPTAGRSRSSSTTTPPPPTTATPTGSASASRPRRSRARRDLPRRRAAAAGCRTRRADDRRSARPVAARYGEAYDRVWERSTKLYFSQPDAAARLVQWQAVKAKHRPEALAAKNDDELQRAIYAMLRERPATRSSATGRAAVSSAHPVATAAGTRDPQGRRQRRRCRGRGLVRARRGRARRERRRRLRPDGDQPREDGTSRRSSSS